jgi:hypothetical protein
LSNTSWPKALKYPLPAEAATLFAIHNDGQPVMLRHIKPASMMRAFIQLELMFVPKPDILIF